jgi:hypothetical protein
MRGLNGNQAAEPRVFAHDAVAIVIGAINYTSQMDNPGFNSGLTVTNFGSGYAAGDVITLSAGSGSSAAKVKVLTVNNLGVITSYELTDSGTASKPYGEGYILLDALTQASVLPMGGSGFTATVNNIDIPNTAERGCCLYVGVGADIGIVTEGGKESVVFKGVTTGSFLPVLAKRVKSGISSIGDVLALF